MRKRHRSDALMLRFYNKSQAEDGPIRQRSVETRVSYYLSHAMEFIYTAAIAPVNGNLYLFLILGKL